MNKSELNKEYQSYIQQGKQPDMIILYISMPSGDVETIINPNPADKMDYINKTYNEELAHNDCPNIRITDVVFTMPDDYGMEFSGALDAMKKGLKVKLPSWSGYWYWSEEKETIIMHTKDGEELDIRSTDRVLYTLDNILSDEWVLADESNCPQIDREAVPLFPFSDALRYIRRGLRVARAGWNGKGQYVFLAEELSFNCAADLSEFNDQYIPVNDALVLRNAQLQFQPGWVPSVGDLLADDWYLLPDAKTTAVPDKSQDI